MWDMVAEVLRGQRYDFLSYGIMELWRMRGWEASTSLPFMKMVTLRVLDFAITDVLAKMVQTSVTGWDNLTIPKKK